MPDSAKGFQFDAAKIGAESSDRDKSVCIIRIIVLVATINYRVIGFVIAYYVIYSSDAVKYDARMRQLNMLSSDMGYAYIGLGCFSVAGWLVTFIPFCYKGAVMGLFSGNLRSNQQIFKVVDESGISPYVILEQEGDLGVYNRGTRALYNFVEHSVYAAPCVIASALIFSFPVMILLISLGVMRMIYVIMYAKNGISLVPGCLFGMGFSFLGHGPPFVCATICQMTMEMLTWVAGLRMLAL